MAERVSSIATAKYVEAEGMVHLVSPIGGDFTICGDAFDLASDVPGYEWKNRQSGPVTCLKCILVIEACRGVRTAASQARREGR